MTIAHASLVFSHQTGRFPTPKDEMEFACLMPSATIRVITDSRDTSRDLGLLIARAFQHGSMPEAERLVRQLVFFADARKEPLHCSLELRPRA